MTRFDVWMDTGVCVRVPRGTDAGTDEGLELIRAVAVKKFREMLDNPEGVIDFVVDPFDPEEED